MVLFLLQGTNKMQHLQTVCFADSSHFLIIYFYSCVDIVHFLAKDVHYVYLLLIFCTS